MSSGYNTFEGCFLIEYVIHSIRFLLVHDYMLQEVFLGVGELWKVNHPLQVTCVYNTLPIFLLSAFLAMPSYLFPLRVCAWLLFLYTVLDTAAGVWLDRNGIVSSSRSNKGHDYDPSLELMRRCRHAAAAVGVRVYIHGGLRGGKYLHYLWWSCNDSTKGLSFFFPSWKAKCKISLQKQLGW